MREKELTVLVVGSGGREHAILKACLKSPRVKKVVAAPGNGGMAMEADCRPLDVEDPRAIAALAREVKANFVIVGPEAPLCTGAVDALKKEGILAYGPTLDGARLEDSKAYTKDFLERHGVPTAQSRTFGDKHLPEALEYLETVSYPVVVKASGLAAGKGVIICEDKAKACETARSMLSGEMFGQSGQEIVVEEFLEGEEASIMLMVSGRKYVALPPSQDHKRVGEGDTGPNTGGMGAYAPAAVVTPELDEQIREQIIEPTLKGLETDGIDYRGTLYVGIMITATGPKVLEFNVRFGDPECQILLPLLETDPVNLMVACADGSLNPKNVKQREGYAMIVVVAAEGYPGDYRKGDEISIPKPLPENVQVIHAGTKLDPQGHLKSSGGRVLGIVGYGETLQQAADSAYEVADRIEWERKYYRRDIGWRQLKREG